jgi:hypothetical protein
MYFVTVRPWPHSEIHIRAPFSWSPRIFRVSTWEPSGAFSRPQVSLDVRRGTKGLSLGPRCNGAKFYLDRTQPESINQSIFNGVIR